MEPAGATASMFRYGTFTSPHEDPSAPPVPPGAEASPVAAVGAAGQGRQTYAKAASSDPGRSRTDVFDRAIFNGAKRRSRIRSSHDRPVRFSTRYPAVMNIRF